MYSGHKKSLDGFLVRMRWAWAMSLGFMFVIGLIGLWGITGLADRSLTHGKFVGLGHRPKEIADR
jgi:hypothetical protein